MAHTRFDRIEIKLVAAQAALGRFGAALRAHMGVDPHGDRAGRYPIVTLYYDTPDFDAYWDRERGVASRRKLRVRIYGGRGTAAPPACFVEIKQKHYGRVVKRRLALSSEDALALCAGAPRPAGLSAADRLVADEVHDMVRERAMRPVCVVRYDRQAFIGRGDAPDLRVTIDRRVRCRAHDLSVRADDDAFTVAPLPDAWGLIEIKVDQAMPLWLARAATALGAPPSAFSKYSASCEALGLVGAFAAPLDLGARRGVAMHRSEPWT